MRQMRKTEDVLEAIKTDPSLDVDGIRQLCPHVSLGYIKRLKKDVYEVLQGIVSAHPDQHFDQLLETACHTHPSLSPGLVSGEILKKMLAVILDGDDHHGRVRRPQSVMRAILQRRGQAEFREALLKAYGGRCCITECDAEPALEAAHIISYAEARSQDVRSGLLLRADIHTLFDLDLFGVDPKRLTVVLGPALKKTIYKDLGGRRLLLPAAPLARPNKQALAERWKRFAAG